MTSPVAFDIGASRGIGKAIAIELAQAGYDIAILARTVHEGEEREHSSTLERSDTSPLPGSLDSTAERIAQDMAGFGFDAAAGAPAEAIGKVCRWLLESPEADCFNGRCIEAQALCSELGLLPGWSLPGEATG
ncbi:MAG: hypothetical protein JRF61_06260 [Deltaproteobacteria bacterium]|jgi:NAD(P)-dependent dehydrogenase (short-subunit alcohol dehydrogenase family)|nr:hypothetical protein [Deltaproteobacteria bacterium]